MLSASFSASLSDYRCLELVGQGQFAQVYCAVHRSTGQLVAIKQTRHAHARPSQEASLLTRFKHPHIVGCYAVKSTADGCLLILEYCESGTLRHYLDSVTPLPFAQAKTLTIDLLKALDYVHAQNVIHDDLKPENVLLTYSSNGLSAKLSDFGNAYSSNAVRSSDTDIGSPTYAAPERFEGHASYAADCYSVGVILYEMLIGDRPFSGSPQQLKQAHKTQSIPLPDNLTNQAVQLITTALHKDPNQRFTTARAMLAAVQQLSSLYQKEHLPINSSFSDEDASIHHCPNEQPIEAAIAPVNVSEPVKAILSVSEGCYVQTKFSLSLIDLKMQRSRIASIRSDAQITAPPYYSSPSQPSLSHQWFITFDEQLSPSAHSRGELYRMNGSHSPRSVVLPPLLKAVENYTDKTKNTRILALNNRYLLRISTLEENLITSLECFTHQGQLVGCCQLNFKIVHAPVARSPYQLITCIQNNRHVKEGRKLHSSVAVISLNPFHIRYLPYAETPLCACAMSWGYAVVDKSKICFFDRTYSLIGTLGHTLDISAIASLSDHRMLLSTPRTAPYLHLLELNRLDLDIIF